MPRRVTTAAEYERRILRAQQLLEAQLDQLVSEPDGDLRVSSRRRFC